MIARSHPWFLASLGLGALCLIMIWDWFFRPVGAGLDAVGHPIGRDFINSWAAPRLVAQGRLADLFDLDAYWKDVQRLFGAPFGKIAWSYPPTALALFTPFSLLPYGLALGAWTGLGWLAFIASVRSFTGPSHKVVLAIALAAPGAWMCAFTGQNGLFTSALMLAGLSLCDRRPIIAGVLIGLLTVKPQLGLLLPFALIGFGAWRTMAAAAATAIALALLAFALYGAAPFIGYFKVSAPFSAWVLSQSWGGQKLMLVSLTSALTQAGLGFRTALLGQGLFDLAVLLTGALAWRATSDRQARIALVITASLLVTPYGWSYDLPAFSLIMGLALWRAETAPVVVKLGLAAGFLAPALSYLSELFHLALAPVLMSAGYLALVSQTLSPSRQSFPEPSSPPPCQS